MCLYVERRRREVCVWDVGQNVCILFFYRIIFKQRLDGVMGSGISYIEISGTDHKSSSQRTFEFSDQ